MKISDWIAIAQIIVTIVISLYCGKEVKEVKELKIQFTNLQTKINNIEMNVKIINKGLGYRDTKELAEDVVAEKTKNKPDVIFSDKEPQNLKEGDQWIAPY